MKNRHLGFHLRGSGVDERKTPGYYSEVWDLKNNSGSRVAPGIYFCRMEGGKFKQTKKLVLLK